MEHTYFFAVDLGATSGRTILGCLGEGKMELKELTRFPNHIIETGGHCYWDIYALYNEIIRGLKVVAKDNLPIRSIGIDTWGVDFVFVGKDGELLRNPYCYRDPHTTGAPEEYFTHIPRERVYDITGIQIMNFNSLFQLSTLHRNHCSALEAADKILFMPDALSYMLTGKMVTEYTIASTSQMLNPRTKRFEKELLDVADIKEEQFGRFVFPGEPIGVLTEEVQKITGLGAIPIIAVAGHDTGSAVAAVPAQNERFAYLSSGTWSLMGIEVKDAIINKESFEQNFTNEGGVEGTPVPEKHLWHVAVGALPQRMGSNQQLFLHRTDRCRSDSSRFPQSHQSRCPLLLQSDIYDSSHRTLLQRNQPTCTTELWRNHPLHIRQSCPALQTSIRLFATNGPVPHRKAAHYRWRLTKQSVKPVHLQCSGRACHSRSQ